MTTMNKTNTTMKSTGSGGATYIAPYIRHNRDSRDIKKMSAFINDSTYLVASDPNTMRDQGSTRNAIYNIKVEGDLNSRYKPNFSTRLNTMIDTNSCINASKNIKKETLNRSFYSFGGNTPIKVALDHKNKVN